VAGTFTTAAVLCLNYVLDLRNNPGGILDQAIAIARMWIDEGRSCAP
jgi:C-terminal processing protease CtpA/Prc